MHSGGGDTVVGTISIGVVVGISVVDVVRTGATVVTCAVVVVAGVAFSAGTMVVTTVSSTVVSGVVDVNLIWERGEPVMGLIVVAHALVSQCNALSRHWHNLQSSTITPPGWK